MMISVHRANYNEEELKRYLYLIEDAKREGSEGICITFSKKDNTPAPIEGLKKFGYEVEVTFNDEDLIQYKISWDMEKLTAAEAKKIALSKSDLVSEMVSDCLGQIKSQAENGKFICSIYAIYNESNVEAIKQLKELGYDISYGHDMTTMQISIRW